MPEAKTFTSIYNLKPSGLSALYEICKNVFAPRQVSEWALPYRKLKGATKAGAIDVERGVLIIVNPDESLAEFEVEDILDWVRQGNALVYLDNFQFRHTKRMLDKMDIRARDLEETLTDRQSDAPREDRDRSLVICVCLVSPANKSSPVVICWSV